MLTMSASRPASGEDALPPAADEDRRVRLLHRPRAPGKAVGVHVGAVDSDVLATPVGTHQLDDLGQPGDAHAGRIHGDAEPFVLGRDPTRPETDLEPAVGEQVDRGHLLGQHDRLVKVDVEDAAADTQPGGDRGGGRHRRDRGDVDRSVARGLGDRARAEVVVGREQRAVAEVFGVAGDLGPLLAGRGLEGLDGEAERALRNSSHGTPKKAGQRFRRRTLLNYDSSNASGPRPLLERSGRLDERRYRHGDGRRRRSAAGRSPTTTTPGSRTTTSSPTSTCVGSAPIPPSAR